MEKSLLDFQTGEKVKVLYFSRERRREQKSTPQRMGNQNSSGFLIILEVRRQGEFEVGLEGEWNWIILGMEDISV